MSTFVTVARIVRSRGIRGEVVAELLTDFPERFDSTPRVFLRNERVADWEELERHWFHKGRVILKFVGRDRPEDNSDLMNAEVQVLMEDRVDPPEDMYFHSDLIECVVKEGDRTLGRVSEIFETGVAGSSLIVVLEEGGELMVPFVRQLVRRVDIDAGVVEVELPKGLLELARGEKSAKKKKRS